VGAADILDAIQLAVSGQAVSVNLSGRRLVREADALGTILTSEMPPVAAFRL
jgi:hypothetical protein